ncbi:hypothetical protein D9M70_569640 [compost metagenome]
MVLHRNTEPLQFLSIANAGTQQHCWGTVGTGGQNDLQASPDLLRLITNQVPDANGLAVFYQHLFNQCVGNDG